MNDTRIVPDGIKTWMQTLDSTAERLDVILTREGLKIMSSTIRVIQNCKVTHREITR